MRYLIIGAVFGYGWQKYLPEVVLEMKDKIKAKCSGILLLNFYGTV